ncbi:MAG: type II 3-dehydroquinate dehydratase [Desulfotignum sp.]
MPDIFVINGPNLNMLGKREPDIYGSRTLEQINRELTAAAEPLGLSLYFFQSNHEGALVDRLQHMVDQPPAGMIINPGGLTHTSVVLRDALVMVSCPKVEVHLSNIYQREPFRHTSLLSDIVTGQITGFGHFGYHMALSALHHHLSL